MNIQIDVFSTAYSFQEEDVRDKTIVVIDILRACSTIVTALDNGAKGIIPVEDMAAAGKIASNLDSSGYLLCGEKDGIKIDGYHLGNSPLEYTKKKIGGKILIFNTTNGTRAISRTTLAENVMVGSFLNLDAIVNALKLVDNEVILVCAGWKSRLSLEDMLCAGNIIYNLMDGTLPEDARDGAKVAFVLYEHFKNNIAEVVKASNHAIRLNKIIGPEDAEFCSQVSIMNVLPVLKDGILSNSLNV